MHGSDVDLSVVQRVLYEAGFAMALLVIGAFLAYDSRQTVLQWFVLFVLPYTLFLLIRFGYKRLAGRSLFIAIVRWDIEQHRRQAEKRGSKGWVEPKSGTSKPHQMKANLLVFSALLFFLYSFVLLAA